MKKFLAILVLGLLWSEHSLSEWVKFNCENLKKVRAKKNLKLSYISKELNVSSEILSLIEDDNFPDYINSVYLIGHIRSYAKFLDLNEKEMDVYRRPFLKEIERRPTLDWPRQIPIENEPEEVCKIVEDYSSWMSLNEIPKLFINADPGAILIGEQREFCRKWKNQKEITVKVSHFIQEDSPHEIGDAISEWLQLI